MTASAQDLLADRIRTALAGQEVREVRMFGGLSFMVDGSLAVAAGGDGGLLVRIDPARSAELATRPGVAPAVMKNGRQMGPGWLHVAAEAVTGQDTVGFWLQIAQSSRPV